MSDETKKDLPQVPESAFTKDAGAGRPNAPSKKRQSVYQMVQELGGNPVELCVRLIHGDHKFFGFDHATTPRYDKEGNIVGEEMNLKPELRLQGAKTLMDFMFSKNLKLTGDEDEPLQFKGKVDVDMRKLVSMIKTAKGE